MGDDSGDPGAGAVAIHTAGNRGECHGCRGDVAAVDCTTEDSVEAVKFLPCFDELPEFFAISATSNSPVSLDVKTGSS